MCCDKIEGLTVVHLVPQYTMLQSKVARSPDEQKMPIVHQKMPSKLK